MNKVTVIVFAILIVLPAAMAETYIIDDSDNEFDIIFGPWWITQHPHAVGDSTHYILPNGYWRYMTNWRLDALDPEIEPGTYDVYVWKFDHQFNDLVTSQATFHVFYSNGGTIGPILVDQSTPGNEWIYLGQYYFDDYGAQGVVLTTVRPGIHIADAAMWISAAPVHFSLTPGITTIPAEGGQLTYDVWLANTTNITQPDVNFWTTITLPNGNTVGPLMNVPFTVTPMMNVLVQDVVQNVPGFAPPGNYTFSGYLGTYPNSIQEDSFQFTKQATGAGSSSQPGNTSDWTTDDTRLIQALSGREDDSAETQSESTLLGTYSLSKPWPNPFNPTTTVSISLPESTELKVALFNTMGQQVAQLANGQFNAGVQTFTIDGSNLASGIYFVRATVPGHHDQVQKVMLVR